MAGFEPATSRLTVEVTHVFTTGKYSMPRLRALPPSDPSVPLPALKPRGGPEIQPWFLQIAKRRQNHVPPLPTIPEKISGTAPFFDSRSPSPDKACSQFFPDAAGPDPASRHGWSSLQTKHQLARENRLVHSTTRKV